MQCHWAAYDSVYCRSVTHTPKNLADPFSKVPCVLSLFSDLFSTMRLFFVTAPPPTEQRIGETVGCSAEFSYVISKCQE